ncbi:MAG: hypothetical protein ACM3KL_04600, partial [Alphaproteobacteria bacterium]
MKRSVITALIIGIGVALVVGALHFTKSMAGFENATAQLVGDYADATRVVGDKWQCVFVLLVALGTAWISLTNLGGVGRWRSRLLVGLLLVELFGLAWVC